LAAQLVTSAAFVERAMAETLKVAIIGAGLGGLTLAKTLLQPEPGSRPVEVCIYEAWDHWKVRGGALGLAAGARILRRLGLGDQLAEVANQVDGFDVHFHANGIELRSMHLPACTAMRKDLQKILVDSLPSSCIKLGHKLVEITEGTDEVTLEFENGESASAHLVVASDGIHSFARQKIFDGDQPVFTGFRVLYSISSKPFRADPTVANVHWKEVEGAGYGLLDMTAGRGESRHDVMIIIMRSEEHVSDRWDSTLVKERLEEFAAHVAPDHPALGKAVECSEVCFDWGIYKQPTRDSWISPKGRVVLLGDAAHATAPFMGQGANMAMHDAFCLGEILMNEAIAVEDGLKLYETSRKAYCEAVVSKSSMVGGLHTASGFKAALRNNFLCWMMLRTMRKVVATDPTARKPWEKSPRRFSRFFQQWGKKIHSICSQSAKV